MNKKMTAKEHKKIHKKLHKELDELIADFIRHTTKLPSQSTLLDLMSWSYKQTQNPTEISE